MGHVKIWVHIVWSTGKREKSLTSGIKAQIIAHIRENAKKNNIYIDFINGHLDHIHCLISLGSSQSIDKILMQFKGESSHWINKNGIVKSRFCWQDEYFAVSVSDSGVNRVREYIKNQEKHHTKKTFEEEYQEFIRLYNF